MLQSIHSCETMTEINTSSLTKRKSSVDNSGIKMQPTGSGGGGGLSRFRSAPATWLEALLESEEEDVIIDPPKPTLTPPPPHNIAGTTTRPAFADPNIFLPSPVGLRQNSSPAEFFSQINNPDGYLSNYSTPNYEDYLSSSYHNVKPSRDVEQQAKFTTQLSGDQSALLDVEMDKLLGDSVPCRVRAKRGCATHPRSIAERVRRTRISDRIRKLQELVPNMDKVDLIPPEVSFIGVLVLIFDGFEMQQTNTADMLEEAVEYVKFLQTQIQELREHRDKCTCVVND
ncbi:hypothetical protein LXL04_007821 [Taraxacum kok-saghyz]